jgi:hypothetical protein
LHPAILIPELPYSFSVDWSLHYFIQKSQLVRTWDKEKIGLDFGFYQTASRK